MIASNGGRGRSGHERSLLAALALAVVSALLTLVMTVYGVQTAEAQTSPPDERQAGAGSLSGTFATLWGDPEPSTDAEPETKYVVDDGQGQPTELLLDKSDTREFGGPQAFDGERVEVEGAPVEDDQIEVQSIDFQRVEDEREARAAVAAGEPAAEHLVSGSKPFVTIGCRFADSTNVTPRSKTYFDGLMGTTQPGMDHFWRELSYNNINLTGSKVSAWYNLPRTRAAYFNLQDPNDINLDLLARDCTAAADANVFYPNFYGINMMFNQNLDCCAWGGRQTLTIDGQTKTYHVTWMPPWAYDGANHEGRQRTLAHEMGHAFGLPHSSGPYNQTYDSYWDPVSYGGDCSPLHTTYGCRGDHTISYHKDLLGWIPDSRKYTATTANSQNITLERLGVPNSNGAYLMAQIPIAGSTTQFYTVEARRFTGYDSLGSIPGEAVVIHKVNTTLDDRNAKVVDPDNNGNPNDAGARWTAGETFVDAANGIRVRVNSSNASGYYVTINPVDTTKPRITQVSPTPGQTGVFPTANVKATFSEAMKSSTINNTTFSLKRDFGNGNYKFVGVNVTYSSSTKTAVLDPINNLAAGGVYVATVTTGTQDLAGNPLDQKPSDPGNQGYFWRFVVKK